MENSKKSIVLIIFLVFMMMICTVSNAAVGIERNVYSNNGSMKFNVTGLTLNKEHDYEFGLTAKESATVETWHEISEYTTNTATINITTTTTDLRKIINTTDTGYITIRDKTDNSIVMQPKAVDLKIPFFKVSNYTVIKNGKDLRNDNNINIGIRNASVSVAYYQYEKITDTAVISKYKQLKAQNGDYLELESLLKQNAPTSNWAKWGYWNGYDSSTGLGGYGYTQSAVSVPDTGLYYMWLYFSGNNIKDIYGYILVDNLEEDIALESISIPQTETIKVGKTTTLGISFTPAKATNKIVTWSSSDETVATVSNDGVVTAKKVGSAIITAVSQDGNKKSSCTVTVTDNSNSGDADENKIPSDAKEFNGHKYYIYENSMTWQEAKEYCENLGGYLVTITSKEEQEFIQNYIAEKNYSNKRFWIGTTDSAKEGTWTWVTGEKFSYNNWGKGEPDDLYGQDYGMIQNYRTATTSYTVEPYQWDDIKSDSNSKCYFICEWGKYVVEEDKTSSKTTDSSSSKTSGTSSSTSTKSDGSTTKSELPKTGKSMAIVGAILLVIVLGIAGFAKYYKLKDVK